MPMSVLIFSVLLPYLMIIYMNDCFMDQLMNLLNPLKIITNINMICLFCGSYCLWTLSDNDMSIIFIDVDQIILIPTATFILNYSNSNWQNSRPLKLKGDSLSIWVRWFSINFGTVYTIKWVVIQRSCIFWLPWSW